jgi:hypothetical protein
MSAIDIEASTEGERMQAALAKLRAETELIELQNRKLQAEMTHGLLEYVKLQSEAQRMADEPAKVRAETSKLDTERRKILVEAIFYPFVAFTGVVAATLGLLKLAGLLK